MLKLAGTSALLTLGALLFSFSLGEIAVRQMGETDQNGQFRFRGYAAKPRALPRETLRKALEAYSDSGVTLEYDPLLGWKPLENSTNRNGLYHYNSAAVRADREYSPEPDTGVVRVLLFGDSFVHGDEVPVEDCFAERTPALCESLGASRPVEVINLGVPGYGLDQAFLRLQRCAGKFHPDVVVVGFQPENVMRVTNIIRLFYFTHTGLPFSKPRFLLGEGELSVVNSPCIPPEEVATVLEDPSSWEAMKYEDYYHAADYVPTWWRRSRLIGFLEAVIEAKRNPPWRPFEIDSEGSQITLELLERCAEECEKISADMLVLHLPVEYNVRQWQEEGRFTYQALLDTIDERYELIHTEDMLSNAAGDDPRSLYKIHHYSARGHAVVAKALAQALVDREQG